MVPKKSLERFIERAPVAIGMFDRDMRYIMASQRWLIDNGLSGADFVGQRLYDFVPAVGKFYEAAHRRAFAGERVTGAEDPYQGPDGSLRWARWDAQPWFEDDGAVGGVVIFTEDITARKTAEQAAHLNSARVRAILETSSDAILTFDRAGVILDANSAAAVMLGRPLGTIAGNDIRGLFPTPGLDRVDRYFDHCLRGDDSRIVGNAIETEARRADGTAVAVELSIGKVDDLAMFVATIRDISKRKAAERALREGHAELERRVEERTRALAVAKQSAEQASAFKTRFLAAASHDLRQPLQSLGLYLGVLTRQLHEPQQLAICDKMEQSRDAVAHILEALLDVSKLESGAVTPQRSEFELRPVLERVVTDNLPQAEAKGLALSVVGADCTVYSDSALFERVIENLVGNAIRYTERGQVTLGCEIVGGFARVAVSDSGVGIPPAALDKIFDEYYQIENESRDRRKGLGLGLSIVKHIARLLEHPIEVRSVPGEGSTFTVTVPLGQAAGRVAKATHAAAPMPEKRDRVVLLIDDEPAIVDATTLLLESAGLVVHAAASGDAARELLAAGVRPDMIVCDYRLPGGDGVKVIGALRQITKTVLPAILLTGDTSRNEIERAQVPDCTVLHKPVDAEKLIRVIEAAFHAHGA